MGKRVIFTVTNDLRYDQRMFRICSTLTAAGYEVALVGRELPSSTPLQNQSYSQTRLKHLLFRKGKLFYIEFNLRLLLFLLLQRFDAVCSIDLDTAIPGILATKIKRKIHLFDAHELFTHTPEVDRRKSIQKIWEVVQKFTFKHTHAAITVGPAIAQYFQDKYKKPVAVVRNMPFQSPTNASSNQLNPKTPSWQSKIDAFQGQPFILYQGALNESRGLETLIHAMSQIPAMLVIAGEGDLSLPLRQLAKKLQLEHKILFLGMVTPDELPQLTQQAYIGYNVSENAGLSYYLSLNNKFFDYTQAHLPSLINPFPEYLALMKEFAVGLPTEPHVEDVIKQANQLLSDQSMYDAIKANCKVASAKWTWENETPKLLRFFDNALS